MYWTRLTTPGSISSAGMDGSSPLRLITGLGAPYGLTIDHSSQRLFWTDYTRNNIQSSDVDEQDVQLVLEFPSGSNPWGITVLKGRIYWVNDGNNMLQSATKDGQDVQTLYTETNGMRQIIIAPAVNQPTNRTNDCAGRSCSKLYVLAPASYRCLA